MALVNEAKKEINAKIVYIGAKGAGKATALRFIYSRLKPDSRSDLKCIASGEHQMLFFDFSYPGSRRSDGYTFRFHIYTIISGGESAPPWKMLLKGADGIAFLANSAKEKMYGNLEACTILYDSIVHYGLKIEDLTLSLLCNKRDLDGAVSLDEMRTELMPELSVKTLPVTAVTGEGLLNGLDIMIREIMRKLGAETAATGFTEETEATATISKESETASENFESHCTGEKPDLEVETSGPPLAVGSNTVVIPLRLKGGACGKAVEFKVKVSVTL